MTELPTLAVWKFASCDGCQLTLLDCEDELLTLAGQVKIAHFLEDESLAFCGFQLPKENQAMFWQRFPLETWPGSLENWARFEEERPQLFENMYLFWCQKI